MALLLCDTQRALLPNDGAADPRANAAVRIRDAIAEVLGKIAGPLPSRSPRPGILSDSMAECPPVERLGARLRDPGLAVEHRIRLRFAEGALERDPFDIKEAS
jgi:hypothetical protein